MKLALCIVGCGRYADAVLNDIHDMTDEFDFYFASRDLEKAREYCERFGGADYFGSYEEALSDTRVQAAYFFTPHHVHLENTELAARHGKHILVEKPIARTIEESRKLMRTAEEAGVKLMVAETSASCTPQDAPSHDRDRHTWQHRKPPPHRHQGRGISTSNLPLALRRFADWRRLIHRRRHPLCGPDHEPRRHALSGYAATPTKVHRHSEGEDGLVLIANLPNDAVAVFNFSRATSRNAGYNYVGITGTQGYIEFEPYGSEITFENTLVRRTVRLPEAHRGAREMVHEFRSASNRNARRSRTAKKASKTWQ